MIFKTIQDDVTGANKSIALFGKTFNDFKNDISNRGIKGLFTTGINNEDIKALQAYNADIKNGLSPQTAYYNNLQKCSSAAVELAESAGDSEIPLEKMQKATTNMSLSAKAGSVALKGLAIAGNMLAGWGISIVISGVASVIDELVNSEKNLQNAATELGSSLKSSESDISNYKTKIEDLYKTINDSGSSVKDVAQARIDLMSVQDELIEKFGDEKGAIDNITDAINGQTDALDELSKKSYYQAKNKFNEKTTGDKVSDVLSHGSTDAENVMSNMDKMISKMRYSAYELETTGNEILDNLIAKSYGLNIFDDMYGDGQHFSITGDLDEIQEKLYGIQEMASDFDVSTGFENSLTGISNEVDDALVAYKDLYDQYVLYEKVLNSSKDNQYDEQFDAINKAKEAYDKAFANGDKEQIDVASKEFADTLNSAMNLAMDNYDDDVADYFRNMYPDLQQIVSEWEFSANFEPNTDGLKDKVTTALSSLDGMSSEDILNFNANVATQEQIDAYGTLNNVAQEYGMTIEQLITLLEHQKLVSSEAKQELDNKFGKDNIDTLSDEDLQYAFQVSDGTIQSWDELQKAIADAKAEAQNSNETTLSFADSIAQVQSLAKGFDQLDKIYSDVKNKEDFDWSSILNNEDFKNTFGGFKEEYNNFIQTVSNAPNDLKACQQAFDDLATAYLYALDADGNIWVDSVTEETKAASIAMLEQMGIKNADAIVTDILAQKERDLALAKQFTTLTGEDLANASYAEIQSLSELGKISSDTAQDMDLLAFKKQWANRNTIKTYADIQNLMALASTSSTLTQMLSGLASAKAAMNSTNAPAVAALAEAENKKLEAKINGYLNGNFGNYEAPEYTGGSKSNSSSSKTGSDSTKKQTSETFDFIETRLDRLGLAFDKLKTKGENVWLSFTTRIKAYSSALKNVNKQISTQQQAYNAYMIRANSVGLEDSWAKQVRDGSINIADITDDGLKERIKNYQSWYEKASNCKDKLEELKKTQKELTQQKIETLITKYEKYAQKAENANKRISNWIDIKETWGSYASATNYNDMNKNISTQIKYIEAQNTQFSKLRETVKKGSEAWYEYNERIDSNKESLQDLKKQMAENATAVAGLAKAKADKTVEKYDSKDELYDAKIDNATSAKGRNDLINKKVSNINSKQKAYDKAVSDDKKYFNSAKSKLNKFKSTKTNKKVLKEVQKYTKSGKRIPPSILKKAYDLKDNGSLYNACVKYNAYLDAYVSDKEIADLFKETAQQEKANLAMDKFNNIADEYDNQRSANEQKETSLNNKIALAKEQGKTVSESYYKELISNEDAEQKKLITKRTALQNSLNEAVKNGSIKTNSEEWFTMVNAINDVTNAIDESSQSLVQYKNELRQLRWDNFDKGMETMKRLNSEAYFYIDLMSKNQQMVDKENGDFTKYGEATMKLHQSNLKSYLEQAQKYQIEYNDLMAKIARGEESLDDEAVINRLRELQDAQRDSILSAEDEKKALADLVREGYDTQLNALDKLINKFKDLKSSEKDTLDYQKKIRDSVKNITNLRKQMIALGGNDTEEAKAQLQKLQIQLRDEQDKLAETQQDKFLKDTEDMLDEMYSDYSDFIDEKLSDINSVLASINDMLGDNGSIVKTLNELNNGISKELNLTINGEKVVFPAYAKGSKNIDKNQLAWTQDGGSEMIYRKADGAMLTPLGKGDMIFTHEMSENLMKLAQQPLPLMNGLDLQPLNFPTLSKNVNQPISVEFNGDIVLPDVTNSKEFADSVEGVVRDAMCRNGKTTQCVAEAVSAKQLGKSGVGNARMYR